MAAGGLAFTEVVDATEGAHIVRGLFSRNGMSRRVDHDATRPTLVGMDLEGHQFGTPEGRISLIQIADETGQVYLFDVGRNCNIISSSGLKNLLTSNDVVKVMHDCRGDSSVLYNKFGIVLKNVFDTQAAQIAVDSVRHMVPSYKKQYAAADAIVLIRLYIEINRILSGNAKQLYQKLRDFNVYQHIHPDWVKENRKVLNKDELNCLLRNNPRMQLSNKEKKLLGYL
ncbi:hypothetical protein ScPMuIL_000364 [Solemya velum]